MRGNHERVCHLCKLSQTCRGPVWGSPQPNPNLDPEDQPQPYILVVGETPGPNEDKRGIPWIGMTGDETRHLFFINSISPQRDVYWTNLVKCMPPPEQKDPTQQQIQACEPYLLDELMLINPVYILALGRYAARWFLGQDITMDRVNGIPYDTDWGVVIPILNPAAGLRRPEDMVKVQYGFGALRALIDGDITPRRLGFTRRLTGDYKLAQGTANTELFTVDGAAPYIALDTEWAKGKPWCITITHRANQADMILASNQDGIRRTDACMYRERTEEIVIHNSAYDLPVLEQMGISIPTEKLRDSMVAAYLLQVEPQGLKDLASRILNVEMDDYTDVVRPYRYAKAINYLRRILEYEWPDPEQVLEFKADGTPHIRQPQNISRLVQSILTAVEAGKQVDPYERWRKIRSDRTRSDIKLVEYNCGILYDGDLSDAPLDTAREYACSDSNATHQIWPHLRERVIAEGMWDVFLTDMAIMPMVADMMRFGIKVDTSKLSEIGVMFDRRLSEIHARAVSAAEVDFNPNSPTQVSDLLYNRLGMGKYVDKSMGKKKRGASGTGKSGSGTMTEDAILARLESYHPVVKWIREYREYSKLKSSYVDALPAKIGEDGRVHATFRVTRTATGRLSCSDPNLMAMPVRSKDGRVIREAFVGDYGCVIACADYSQVEMRLTASESGDERMIGIFRRGEDIHNKTASAMFGIAEGNLDEMKHRYPAKRVGFGVLNDISAMGLQREMVVGGANEEDWPVSKCQDLIDAWFDVYPGVRAYMDRNRAYAARHGKIVDMWGRVRWIPWAKTKSSWKREEGLKQAGNTPIQSGAQGIIKRAMAQLQPIYVDYRRKGVRVVPLIQIHDDLVSEIDAKVYKSELAKIQKHVMEHADGGRLQVPLKVDQKAGERWGSAEKVK